MFKWFYNLFFKESVDIKELREECNSTIKKMHNRTEQMKTSLNLIQDQVVQYKSANNDSSI